MIPEAEHLQSAGSSQSSESASEEKPSETNGISFGLSEALQNAFSNVLLIEDALGLPRNPESPFKVFMEACAKGDAATLLALLNSGIDVNRKTPEGFTGLMLACCQGHLEIVPFLINAGADMDARIAPAIVEKELPGSDKMLRSLLVGATPFMFAKANDYEAIASLLVVRGADVSFKTEQGDTGETIHSSLKRRIPDFTKLRIFPA